MAPISDKSKGGKARDSRTSRNTTPMSTGSVEHGGSTSSVFSPISYADLLDKYCRGPNPPDSAASRKLLEELTALGEAAKQKSSTQDKKMRELSRKRKDAFENERNRELEAAEEERREQSKRVKRDPTDEDRPPAVGAHRPARQDGGENEGIMGELDDENARLVRGEFREPSARRRAPPRRLSFYSAAPKPRPRLRGTTNSDEDAVLNDVADADVQERQKDPPSPTGSASTSSSQQQPPKALSVPQFQTFGSDPTTFPDPTIYDLREINDEMTEEEAKEILGVAVYPQDDLHDFTPGTPPDKDLSQARPTNQTSSSAFLNHIEPYIKPLTDEDLAFLKEKGDRQTPFIMPRRGNRPYKERWAEEDGAMAVDSTEPVSTNQPQGNIEQMNDEVAETNQISIGPVVSRILSLFRPERRAPAPETNGTPHVNGDSFGEATNLADLDDSSTPSKPISALPDASQAASRAAPPKVDYKEMEDRAKQELKYIGFLPDDVEPDFDGHHDDEVAARLRYLQGELERVSILNGARKARVLELAQAEMASQEYTTIEDDLDSQLNQAYLKRHRNIGKGKKNLKRAGGPGGGSHSLNGGVGVSRPSVGEPIRALMDRRKQWRTLIGPVVNYGRRPIPEESIFDEATMAPLVRQERDTFNDNDADAQG